MRGRLRRNLAAVLVGCAVLTACGGCGEDTTCYASEEVRVTGRSLGVRTGFDVRAGDVVRVRADPDGRWGMQNGPANVGPEGIPGFAGAFRSRAPNAPFGSLVGWLDRCPHYAYAIGTGADLVARCRGELVLAANDNFDPACRLPGEDPALKCHADNPDEAIGACLVVMPPR